jgi:GNAT superfamily N-acetyltransferase
MVGRRRHRVEARRLERPVKRSQVRRTLLSRGAARAASDPGDSEQRQSKPAEPMHAPTLTASAVRLAPRSSRTSRRATHQDSEALGRLGALLMEVHYGFDRRRFLAPGEDAASRYGQFVVSHLHDPSSAVFVAELDGALVGYCYAGIEPLSWKELRDEAGFIHDLAIEPTVRRRGVGKALVEAAIEWFRGQDQARVMLWTSPAIDAARDLFERSGFRPTMIEMTRELRSQ